MEYKDQKQSWYSLLFEEKKEVIRKRKRDAYAQKKAIEGQIVDEEYRREKTRSGIEIEKDKTSSGAQKHAYKQEKIKLIKNMRAKFDLLFNQLLLQIGNGTEETDADEKIKLPAMMTILYEDDETSLNTLLNLVFPNIHNYSNNVNFMINRAILTPTNDYVDEINNLLIHKFPGHTVKYYSFDETLDKIEQGFQEHFLNTLTPNGLPPHELVLKPGCQIMLIRNISPSEGLCNGNRQICNRFESNIIDAEIATGHYRGKRVFLPRIPFFPFENDKHPFPFKRTQFPIRLSFAMTINKSQCQTLDYVGIYLPQPVFSHGQLYVALSRAKNANSIKVLIRPTNVENSNDRSTKNIVYKELLTLSTSS
ncbi:hypothetical protein Dsin_030672 [Dipteronia sinensis]|uniref:DNA helicase Pif1-like 2B domain-containing protein n=1 Tax=Dipteronia sinensis TaxID=43782 RepID=A0AAD9ZJY9_9ROSI|nr:hypothetical protein Dsin_030672 [Dipteronia sinensis]